MSYAAVIFAHPDLEKSQTNKALLAEVKGHSHIKISNLYERYPDFIIDVEKEQALLEGASAIILQFPLQWYSCPSLLKEWIDKVFSEGFAYGKGKRLTGKKFTIAITTAVEEQFCGEKDEQGNPNLFCIDYALKPFQADAKYCSMQWHQPQVIYATWQYTEEQLKEKAVAYRGMIESLL